LFHNDTKRNKKQYVTTAITSRIIETKLILWNDLKFIQQDNLRIINEA
jgi:hypothetical protein